MNGQDAPPACQRPGARVERIVIRVAPAEGSSAVALEVLWHAPLSELLPAIAAATGSAGGPVPATLVTMAGLPLDGAMSLAAQAVHDGDCLRLVPPDATRPGPDSTPAGGTQPTSTPEPHEPPLVGPCLASPRGWVFLLDEGLLHLGRRWESSRPEIDVTALDPERACSRRHADLRTHGGRTLLTPCRTTNGTFLNGRRLDPGTPVPLSSGDRLELGADGVELVFVAPGDLVPPELFDPGPGGAK